MKGKLLDVESTFELLEKLVQLLILLSPFLIRLLRRKPQESKAPEESTSQPEALPVPDASTTRRARSPSPHPRESGDLSAPNFGRSWVPAAAGMTIQGKSESSIASIQARVHSPPFESEDVSWLFANEPHPATLWADVMVMREALVRRPPFTRPPLPRRARILA